MQGFWVCGGGRCCVLREFSRRRPTHIFTCPFFPCLRPVFFWGGNNFADITPPPNFRDIPKKWANVVNSCKIKNTKINKELLKKFYEFTSGKQEKFWKTNFLELYKSDLDFWRALQDSTK